MDAQTGRPIVQTLGARLSTLGVGDPCPCCGAGLKLRTADEPVRSVPAAGAAGVVGRREKAVLFCPECGCELSAEDGTEDSGGCRRFGIAA